jgi:hypothetical protein
MFQFPAFASQDLWIQSRDTDLTASGFPHSEIAGSTGGCPLPDAYRRLQRPSSPPAAKASTVCACSLDHIPKRFVVVRRFFIHRIQIMRLTRSRDGCRVPHPPAQDSSTRSRACTHASRACAHPRSDSLSHLRLYLVKEQGRLLAAAQAQCAPVSCGIACA